MRGHFSAPLSCYDRPRRHDNPLKREADRQVKAARHRGLLRPPQACQRCLNTRRRLQAHHEDYARPLDITWLCRQCHTYRHRELRAGARAALAGSTERLAIRAYRSSLEKGRSTSAAATLSVIAALEEDRLSRADLARLAGTTSNQINLVFQSGIRTFKTLGALADALDRDVSITLTARYRKSEVA